MADADPPLPHAAISGPGKVSITLHSLRGPLGRSHSVRLPIKQIAFVNAGTAQIAVAHISIDPVQEENRGIVTGAASLQVGTTGPMVAEIGAPFIVTLSGTAPARPGLYTSTLRLHPESGPAVAVPLSIAVAASPAWGIVSTLLGLCVVTLMAGLDEQGAVATKLREALHKRSEAQLFVAQYPEPDGRGDTSAIARAYDDAIAALSRPRSAGLLDHRLEDAAAPLAEADGLTASLRKAAAGLSPSDALVAAATIPWQALQPQLRALATPQASEASGATNPFASRLDALLTRVRARLVGAPARWLENEIAAQFTRLKLIAASGDLESARTQANAVQTAMRRGAHGLASGQRLVMRQGAQLAFLLGTVAEVQQGIADPSLPAQTRADLAAKLEDAQALLTDGADLRRLVDVNRSVSEARTALTLAETQVQTTRIAAALNAASNETDYPEVEDAAAAAQADPDTSPAKKALHKQALLDAWRSTIAKIRDPSARPSLLAGVDAIAAALDRGDSPAAVAAYETLTKTWLAYGAQRVALAGATSLKPFCDGYAAQLQRRLGFIDQELRWEEPNARHVEWDRRRDRIRLALERVAPDGDCLQSLLTLDKDASGLSAAIGAAAADTAGIDAAVRLEAMAVYGVATSTWPRSLTPYADAPASELLVDRPLKLSVGNLDRAWGVGTTIVIGFGDGSPPVVTDAETLRRTPPEHTYTAPLSTLVTALAADAITPDGQAIGTPLGKGTATLLIAPAPDSQARKLADRFLSARFALALVVSLAIYCWRFQARDRIFGARSFDYAEAFALGFAVNAAIAELPAALAKLSLG